MYVVYWGCIIYYTDNVYWSNLTQAVISNKVSSANPLNKEFRDTNSDDTADTSLLTFRRLMSTIVDVPHR